VKVTLATPLPELGEFFVVRTNGWAGWLIRVVTRSSVNHAGVYVGDGRVVEAQPHGAVLGYVAAYPGAIWSGPAITEGRGQQIADAARGLLGTPYSWLDCLAIGLAKIFGHALPGFIRRRLSRPNVAMCSQLCDLAYLAAGVHLFDDNRLPGDVSPGDLYDLILKEK
jgi:cell wall-associated NlpC family hydrolase